MEINDDIHNNHEHASTSLKVLLLIFAFVLIGTLGYMVWLENADTQEATNETTLPAAGLSSLAVIKSPVEAGNFQFTLPAGYGAYMEYGCEGGCLYVFKIGKAPSGSKLISQDETVITVSARKLAEDKTTLEAFNETENLGELTEIGDITVAGNAGKEYSVSGLNTIYYVRFVKDGIGYSLMVSGDDEVNILKSNTVAKKILESWKFN